jgi:hypothetical protein
MQSPILDIRALKLDSNGKSLKQQLGCKSQKSCDYLKKSKHLYFIEISDFHQQLIDLSKKGLSKDEKTYIKMEIKLKLSDSLLIYQELINRREISDKNKTLRKKALLAVCRERESDTVAFAQLERELTRTYCPTHFVQIKVVPYKSLENLSAIQKK